MIEDLKEIINKTQWSIRWWITVIILVVAHALWGWIIHGSINSRYESSWHDIIHILIWLSMAFAVYYELMSWYRLRESYVSFMTNLIEEAKKNVKNDEENLSED